MADLFKIAIRNLLRYRRRTLLTASLITIGVVFVLIFISVSGSFKAMMIGQITDSMIGHLQVHHKGYVASIENLPLNMNLPPGAMKKVETALGSLKEVESASPRIKFGAMFSNFTETTNIRLNGVYPEREFKTVPLLPSRITEGKAAIEKGEILIPILLAWGMGVKVGDAVVIVATNKDGSVNGKQFKVAGLMESATGPGGRDGYVHIEDAVELLRMTEMEISEIAIRLKDFDKLVPVTDRLDALLAGEVDKAGKPIFEVHNWEKLSPFYNIARMIDLMTFFIKLMLIAIVLISIMNVMIMAVYERIREIGTIAAIGTPPRKILSMFLIEGLCLGVLGAISGGVLGVILLWGINMAKIAFDFGLQKGIILSASLVPADLWTVSAIVILVSVIASLQPALRASRMEPIDALRHV
ncbi:MAG TPA: ABC transporter substrate-binding protein [Syntrophus sp. (in: bacteria)]|nr:ABC transporter substrate-binding protein [Syntrophus sp. (in: bacteria)]